MPDHAVVPGLASPQEQRWRAAGKAAKSQRLDSLRAHDPELVLEEARRMAGVVVGLFDQVPDGRQGLAVSHTPLVEAAVYGLTGLELEPLEECEGVRITLDDAGEYRIEELRGTG